MAATRSALEQFYPGGWFRTRVGAPERKVHYYKPGKTTSLCNHMRREEHGLPLQVDRVLGGSMYDRCSHCWVAKKHGTGIGL